VLPILTLCKLKLNTCRCGAVYLVVLELAVKWFRDAKKMTHALPRYEVVDREFLRLKPSAKSKSKTPLIKVPIPSGLALKLLGVGLR